MIDPKFMEEMSKLCEKYNIENAVIGYSEPKTHGIGTFGVGEASIMYELSAALYGFNKSSYHERIGTIIKEAMDVK